MRRITKRRLDIAALCRSVATAKNGGMTCFVGTVRSPHAGRTVRAVTYDGFAPLAEKELERILADAKKRWPVALTAAHRLGRLKVGEASVAIISAAPHRAEAFAACRFVIDEIKLRLPVWKKEHYAKGDGRWLPGCALHRRRA